MTPIYIYSCWPKYWINDKLSRNYLISLIKRLIPNLSIYPNRGRFIQTEREHLGSFFALKWYTFFIACHHFFNSWYAPLGMLFAFTHIHVPYYKGSFNRPLFTNTNRQKIKPAVSNKGHLTDLSSKAINRRNYGSLSRWQLPIHK